MNRHTSLQNIVYGTPYLFSILIAEMYIAHIVLNISYMCTKDDKVNKNTTHPGAELDLLCDM